jgi:hypothetical protein
MEYLRVGMPPENWQHFAWKRMHLKKKKDALRDEYDDLSDLNAIQMENVREWEMQFKEK